jgi:hypothetical protein
MLPQIFLTRLYVADPHRTRKLPDFVHYFVLLFIVGKMLHLVFWFCVFGTRTRRIKNGAQQLLGGGRHTESEQVLLPEWTTVTELLAPTTILGQLRSFEAICYVLPDLVQLVLAVECFSCARERGKI